MSRPAARAWQDREDEDEALDLDLEDGLDLAVGEAAGRPVRTVAPSRRMAPAQAPRTVTRRKVHWGQLVAVTLIGYLVAIGASSELTYIHVSHIRSALIGQIATVSAQNRSLARQIALLHQRRYVDELARTEMGYTSPGEVVLVPRVSH